MDVSLDIPAEVMADADEFTRSNWDKPVSHCFDVYVEVRGGKVSRHVGMVIGQYVEVDEDLLAMLGSVVGKAVYKKLMRCRPHQGQNEERRKNMAEQMSGYAQRSWRLHPLFHSMAFGSASTIFGDVIFAHLPDGIYHVCGETCEIRPAINFHPKYGEGLKPWSLPWTLHVFEYLFSKEVRERIYLPAYQEILADYYRAKEAKHLTGFGRFFVGGCLVVRTLKLIVETIAVSFRGAAITGMVLLVGPSLARWFRELWFRMFS